MHNIKFSSADNRCNVPVIAIWKGQTPTKTVHETIIYNFLPNTILGFVATEKVPNLDLLLAPTESLSDFVDNMIETCDDCEEASPIACEDCENFK